MPRHDPETLGGRDAMREQAAFEREQARRRRARMAELHQQGCTPAQIGERLGMSRDAAEIALRRLGCRPHREDDQ